MNSPKQKKFATLRAWNRKRNYFFKSLRMTMARWVLESKKQMPFALKKNGKVLLLRNDGKIGDMIVSTSLMRELHKNGYTVDVLATSSNRVIIQHNPYIRKIHLYDEKEETTALAAENYDLIIDMGDKTSPASLRFLIKLKGQNVIGFNKAAYTTYNKSIEFLGYDEHITVRYSLLMKELNLKDFSTAYDLFYPETVDQQTVEFLSGLTLKGKIVINPFAADSRRELSLCQLTDLFSSLREILPEYNVIYLDPDNKIKEELPPGIYKNPHNTLFSAISLIAHGDLIISPDTSLVHVAAAYNKPLIALYGNDMHGQFQNNKTWGPGYSSAIQILTQDKQHPISTIAVKEIVESAVKILR